MAGPPLRNSHLLETVLKKAMRQPVGSCIDRLPLVAHRH